MKNSQWLIIVLLVFAAAAALAYGRLARQSESHDMRAPSAESPQASQAEESMSETQTQTQTQTESESESKPKPKQSAKFTVNTNDVVEVKSLPAAASETHEEEPRLWLSFGGGFSLVKDHQSSTDQTKLDYESALPNALSVTIGARLGDRLGLESSYVSTPGKISSNDGIVVQKGSYQWTTMSLEGLYFLAPSWTLRLGVQSQSIPLLVPSGGAIQVTESRIGMASLGLDYTFTKRGPWETSMQLRYEQPFSAQPASGSGSLKVNSRLVFDGSLSQVYHFVHTPYSLGVCWWGQYIDQSFHYKDGTTDLQGDQRIFHSTAEARFIISF